MRTNRLSMALLAGVLGLAASCAGDSARGDREVVVFAASSLSDAFGDIGRAFEASHPDTAVTLSTAGSSSLREQIIAGAPADVLASANETVMDQVGGAGEVDGPVLTFATNRLQIAVPAGNPGAVSGLPDLADPGRLIGLCAVGVPCGDLARQVLDRAGVVAQVDTNEPDVRSLLAKIEADELDAGLVYVTDVAAAGDRVEGIAIDPSNNPVAALPIARLRGGTNPAGAAEFVDFVLSAEGQAILADYGFGLP